MGEGMGGIGVVPHCRKGHVCPWHAYITRLARLLRSLLLPSLPSRGRIVVLLVTRRLYPARAKCALPLAMLPEDTCSRRVSERRRATLHSIRRLLSCDSVVCGVRRVPCYVFWQCLQAPLDADESVFGCDALARVIGQCLGRGDLSASQGRAACSHGVRAAVVVEWWG